MIVIGYQGIGKSTLSSKDKLFVDLESSNFWKTIKSDSGNKKYRPEDWYIYYCNIALDLSNQGYIVFVSSHKEVREELKRRKDNYEISVISIVPDIKLKDEWCTKLFSRFKLSCPWAKPWTNDHIDHKDYKAWKNAEERYEENISEIIDSGFDYIVLDSMEYDLFGLIMNKLNEQTKNYIV